jgi:hypothetical protein
LNETFEILSYLRCTYMIVIQSNCFCTFDTPNWTKKQEQLLFKVSQNPKERTDHFTHSTCILSSLDNLLSMIVFRSEIPHEDQKTTRTFVMTLAVSLGRF